MTTLEALYEAKEILENIEAEYERDAIVLQDYIQESIEQINKAIDFIRD